MYAEYVVKSKANWLRLQEKWRMNIFFGFGWMNPFKFDGGKQLRTRYKNVWYKRTMRCQILSQITCYFISKCQYIIKYVPIYLFTLAFTNGIIVLGTRMYRVSMRYFRFVIRQFRYRCVNCVVYRNPDILYTLSCSVARWQVNNFIARRWTG